MTACCGTDKKALELRAMLTAKEIGDYSIAGVQVKFLAKTGATISCTNCGWTAVGHVEDAVIDGNTFVRGTFVVENVVK